MTRISDIRSPFNRVLARIQQEITDPKPNMDAINELARIGQEAVNAAQRSKRAGNITGNQYESFAYGVYFNGERYRSGLAKDHDWHEDAEGNLTRKGSPKEKRRGKYGFSEALHAVRGHHPERRGYELYLTNAMWYSMYHERWGIRIISQEVLSAMRKVADKFNVDVYIDFYEYPVKG